MRKTGLQVIVLALLTLFVATTAVAQGLRWKITTTSMGKEMNSENFLMPKMMKTVADEGESFILRLDKKVIYTIKPETKEYSELTFEEFDRLTEKVMAKTNAQMNQLKEQMKNMPEAQRKMMEQMMGGEQAASTKKTGEQKNIAGYSCAQHIIMQGEKEVITVWATQEIKEFAGLKKDYEEFAKRVMGNAPGLTGAFQELMKLQGFAMEIQMGSMMTQTVTMVEKKSTPASEFSVPTGYTKVKSKLQEEVEKEE
jgi:hypothetical protein